MNSDDSQRWVLVTGASGGIGAAICRTLARAGFQVLAGVRPGGTPVSSAIAPQVELIDLDLAHPEQLETIRERVAQRTGGDLYALINNAGVAIPGAFELSTRDEALYQIAVNITGAIDLTRELLPLIRTSRGRLVVVTSVLRSGRQYRAQWLTPAAAAGLAAVMIGATYAHIRLREPANVAITVTLFVIAVLVALGRSGV